jgi:hypothetical protein
MSASRLTHIEGVERQWQLEDGRVCVHPYEPGEPAGYVAWTIWADEQLRKRRRKPKCPTPGCPILGIGIVKKGGGA